jgi:hypothetical protein
MTSWESPAGIANRERHRARRLSADERTLKRIRRRVQKRERA